jgi:hypothetical protein
MEGGRWLGHDKYRDLPKLGIDPDAPVTWVPIDDGRRPDNRDPEDVGERLLSAAQFDFHGTSPLSEVWDELAGSHTPVLHDRPEPDPEAGRALMAYQRELAREQSFPTFKTGQTIHLKTDPIVVVP